MSKRAANAHYQSTSRNQKGSDSSSISFQSLNRARVIIRNLAYVVGLSEEVAKKELLLRNEYFGQYGRINKIIISKLKSPSSKGTQRPIFCCYVTFKEEAQAALAILSLDNAKFDGQTLKASFGTTKFCQNFVQGTQCRNKGCQYVHAFPEAKFMVNKDELHHNPQIHLNQIKLAHQLVNLSNSKLRNKLPRKSKKTVFPSPYFLFEPQTPAKGRQVVEMDLSDFKYEKVIAESVYTISRHKSSRSFSSAASAETLFQPKESSRFSNILDLSEAASPVEVPSIVQQSLAFILARQSTFTASSQDILFRSISVSKDDCSDWFRYNRNNKQN